jgi:hypothetical protein
MADLDLASESFLGFADGELASTLRERLALATRYIANWYKATKGSDNQDVWWQKIDALRAKVEATYSALLQPANATFPSNKVVADYNEASAAWAQLWRELTLSADTIDISLISQLADFGTTLINAPGLLVPQLADSLGKALGDSAARFFAQAWPFLLAAGVLGTVYIFRRPLVALAQRGVG